MRIVVTSQQQQPSLSLENTSIICSLRRVQGVSDSICAQLQFNKLQKEAAGFQVKNILIIRHVRLLSLLFFCDI